MLQCGICQDIITGVAWGHILEREDLGRYTKDHAVLLEGIVCHEAARVDVGGVQRIVHVLQQAFLRECSPPDAQLVDVARRVLAKLHPAACQCWHVGLGNDRRAPAVHIEHCRLPAHHVQCQVVPVAVGCHVGGSHRLLLQTVGEHHVLVFVVVQLQAFCLIRVGFED